MNAVCHFDKVFIVPSWEEVVFNLKMSKTYLIIDANPKEILFTNSILVPFLKPKLP